MIYSVNQNALNRSGNAVIRVTIPEQQLTVLGSVSKMLSEGMAMSIQYQDEDSGVLLPTVALRGYEDHYYVYVVHEQENMLGQTILKLTKKDVTVNEMTDDMAVIQKSIENQKVAYMEDRPVGEGSEVMLYDE